MTLVTTRKFQLNTASQWCTQGASCPVQPMSAVAELAKPESHIGSEEIRYAAGLNLVLGFLSNDIKGGEVHIR